MSRGRGARKYLTAKSLLLLSAGYFTAETSLGTVCRVTAAPPPADPSDAGVRSVSLRSGVYADSVKLMQVSRDVAALDGVTAVLVAMATPLNLELAANMGLAPDEPASPEQLLIAVRADDDAALAAAVAAVDAALAARERSTGSRRGRPAAHHRRRAGRARRPTPGAGDRQRARASTPSPRPPTRSPPAAACCVFSDTVPVEDDSSSRMRPSRPPAFW